MIRRTYCPADTRFTTFRKHASNGGHYCWDSQGPSYELPGILLGLYDEEYFLYTSSTTNDRGENENRALRPIYERVSDYDRNEFIIKTRNQTTLRRHAADDYIWHGLIIAFKIEDTISQLRRRLPVLLTLVVVKRQEDEQWESSTWYCTPVPGSRDATISIADKMNKEEGTHSMRVRQAPAPKLLGYTLEYCMTILWLFAECLQCETEREQNRT